MMPQIQDAVVPTKSRAETGVTSSRRILRWEITWVLYSESNVLKQCGRLEVRTLQGVPVAVRYLPTRNGLQIMIEELLTRHVETAQADKRENPGKTERDTLEKSMKKRTSFVLPTF